MRQEAWTLNEWQISTSPLDLLEAIAVIARTGIRQAGRHAQTALGRMIDCERQILANAPKFIGDCLGHDKAPPIFATAGQLIKKDVLPVLCAHYLYAISQQLLETDETTSLLFSSFSRTSLWILSAALFVYTLGQKIQFYTHMMVLQLNFPKAFHQMSALTNQIDNRICKSCDSLRYGKGELRVLAVLATQPIALEFLRKMQIPYLSTIAYPVQFMLTMFLPMLFSGQSMFEYPLASAGICERHRRVNLRRFPELFFMLGLSLQLLTMTSTAAVAQLMALPEFLLRYNVGTVPVLSTILTALSAMPRSAYETQLNGIFLLFMIGLTYYIRFPAPVKESKSYCPELTYFLVDNGIDYSAYRLKKAFRKKDSDNKEVWDVKAFTEATAFYVTAVKYYATTALTYVAIHDPRVASMSSIFVPSLFRSADHAFKDVLLKPYLPSALTQVKKKLNYILHFKNTACDLLSFIKEMDAFCLQKKVQVIAWFAGLSSVNNMLTVDFLVNKSADYLRGLLGFCEALKNRRLIGADNYQAIESKINSITKKLAILRPVLSELPRDELNQLLEFVRSDTCTQWLQKGTEFIADLMKRNVAAHQAELDDVGFVVVDQEQTKQVDLDDEYVDAAFVVMPSKVTRCFFPTHSEVGFVPPAVAAAAASSDDFVDLGDKQLDEEFVRLPHPTEDGDDEGGYDDDIPAGGSDAFGEQYAKEAAHQAALERDKRLRAAAAAENSGSFTRRISGALAEVAKFAAGPDTQPSFMRFSAR